MSVDIYQGDCRLLMKTLDDQSMNCCVTSPPYFGLRDYGCDGQIGLEQSPQEFVDQLVAVFREVRRVLRNDGTLWLNLGDSYAYGGRGGNPTESSSGLEGGHATQRASMVRRKIQAGFPSDRTRAQEPICGGRGGLFNGMKPKDLMGIPWMVAFALRADGWYLRQDIIWSKPNPMPESVTDRCTKAHEYVFLLSKSERYFYDAEAINEPCSQDEFRPSFRGGAYVNNATFDNGQGGKSNLTGNVRRSGNKARKSGVQRGCPAGNASNVCGSIPWEGNTRNRRSVWNVATQPFKEAHFATFPPALIEPCIKAGCPKGGTVLDPFGGAGTTGLVADRFQRNAVLFELNPEYVELAQNRITKDAPLFA